MKKVSELRTLCGVDACAVIYYNSSCAQPDVYPSPAETSHVLERFTNLPIMKKDLSIMNRENFLRQNITRVQASLEKIKYRNWLLEKEQLMGNNLIEITNLHDVGNLKDLKDVSDLLAGRIDRTVKQIDEYTKSGGIRLGKSIPGLNLKMHGH